MENTFPPEWMEEVVIEQVIMPIVQICALFDWYSRFGGA